MTRRVGFWETAGLMEGVNSGLGAEAPLKVIEQLLQIRDVEVDGLDAARQALGSALHTEGLAESGEVISRVTLGKEAECGVVCVLLLGYIRQYAVNGGVIGPVRDLARSEERRVGKECRFR